MTRGKAAAAAAVPSTLAFILALAAGGGEASARIVAVEVQRTAPFAGGQAFGPSGAYTRVSAKARGELDPADPANAGIAGLAATPRNAKGRVAYELDVDILRPAKLRTGNGTILYDVTNRGRKFLPGWLMEAPSTGGDAVNDPITAADAGDGFAYREGFTVVWSGWDPLGTAANGGMTLKLAPEAGDGGAPIARTIRAEWVPGIRSPLEAPALTLPYPVADPDPAKARLTVRDRETDEPREIAAGAGWAYDSARALRLLPDGTKPLPGRIYDLRYPAKDPVALGVGFAAVRDLISFLRSGAPDDEGRPNPLADADRPPAPVPHAIAFGVSQSGRYLRDFVGQGFNKDEAGARVFDGVLNHISGVGRLFLNEPFGQAFRTNTQHEDHDFPENAFPFAYTATEDPLTGRSGTLFRGDGSDPLVIETNTSTEYWQKSAALLHVDPTGTRDLEIPPNVRLYLIAGTQHGGRAGLVSDRGPCANPRNPHDPSPALRALVKALAAWVANGTEPPPSRVPRLADGTLVEPARLGFPAIPGLRVADRANRIEPFGDWASPAPDRARAYPALVPAVDADGNETAGIRLPDIAAPLGTFTGWNLYADPYPAGELCDRDGTYLPFARTRAEREAAGDPRLSLEERYPAATDYVGKVGRAAGELMAAGLLLPDDARRYVDAARSRR